MNLDPNLPTSYEYIHYTSRNIDTLDLNRVYAQYTRKLAFNTPNGLWLSVAGIHDWEQYCRKYQNRLDALQYEFQILLKPQAKILILNNKIAFEGFLKEYGHCKEKYFDISIRWEKIINNYQGIALPHVFPKLMNMFSWYKTWCCTSACIWDLQAVKKVERLGEVNL
ncbi:MAG: hypothetical protein LBC52_03280 [Treponema sp.]|jgi:hypothetical protein|nr:hypothetical protein [Treponema sp.]